MVFFFFFSPLLNFRQYFFLRMSGLSKNNPKTKSQLGGKKNRSFYEDLKAETPTFSDIIQFFSGGDCNIAVLLVIMMLPGIA